MREIGLWDSGQGKDRGVSSPDQMRDGVRAQTVCCVVNFLNPTFKTLICWSIMLCFMLSKALVTAFS